MNLCSNVSAASLEYDLCLAQAEMEEVVCPDPSLCNATQEGDNVGLAFGLTIGAGLATTIGALMPFIPCIKRANTRYLAVGLALAAGVMLYVSFTEIWGKSADNFCCITPDHSDLAVTACFFGGIIITIILDLIVGALQRIDCGCCIPPRWWLEFKVRSSSWPPCCCGRRHTENARMNLHGNGNVSATNGSLQLEKVPEGNLHHHGNGVNLEIPITNGHTALANGSTAHETGRLSNGPPPQSGVTNPLAAVDQPDVAIRGVSNPHLPPPPARSEQLSQLASETDSRQVVSVTTPDGTSLSIISMAPSEGTNTYAANTSVNELFSNSSLQRMKAIIPETESLSLAEGEAVAGMGGEGGVKGGSHVSVHVEGAGDGLQQQQQVVEEAEKEGSEESSQEEALGPKEFKVITEGLGKDTKKLHRMGILTGLALGIHNFPEGLATFVATLSTPRLGAALAVAIAIHNIPEGVCVALPVYYATGSKWKGFLWAFFSGISEPIGALLGWLVLQNVFGPAVYGIAFGLISGMMVFISLKELLPTAYRFDNTHGKIVYISLVIGMLIMAVSLILFLY